MSMISHFKLTSLATCIALLLVWRNMEGIPAGLIFLILLVASIAFLVKFARAGLGPSALLDGSPVLAGATLAMAVLQVSFFTAFSWQHLRILSVAEIEAIAIEADSNEMMRRGLTPPDFRQSYPDFQIETRYLFYSGRYDSDWDYGKYSSNIWDKLFGDQHYQVILPGAVVLVGADGRIYNHSKKRASAVVAPLGPEFGLVGKVLLPDNAVNTNDGDFSVTFIDGTAGTIQRFGSCFKATSRDPFPRLEILSGHTRGDGSKVIFHTESVGGLKATNGNLGYGGIVVQFATLPDADKMLATMRYSAVSKLEFEQADSCLNISALMTVPNGIAR